MFIAKRKEKGKDKIDFRHNFILHTWPRGFTLHINVKITKMRRKSRARWFGESIAHGKYYELSKTPLSCCFASFVLQEEEIVIFEMKDDTEAKL